MSHTICGAALLSLLWALSTNPAGAAEEKAGKGEDRMRSAVQTRCVQECEWLVHRFGEEETAGSKEKLQACRAGCVEAKKVDAALADRPAEDWGLSKEKAIEVCMPVGERAFVEDLRCPDGGVPEYRRSGNVGQRHPSPPGAEIDLELMMDFTGRLEKDGVDRHIIDRYELKCPGGTHVLFMDMYHCGSPKPWKAPKGFSRPLP